MAHTVGLRHGKDNPRLRTEGFGELTRAQFVMELRATESHRSSLTLSQETGSPKDRGTAAVFGTLGYWIPPPYQVPDQDM